MIEQALQSLLTAAGVTVPFRPKRVQGEATTITYKQVSGVDEHTMSGPTGLRNERWQLDVWAGKYAAARELADAVEAALNGKKGTIEGLDVRAIIQLDRQSDLERDADGGDRGQYCVSLDFQCVYRGD